MLCSPDLAMSITAPTAQRHLQQGRHPLCVPTPDGAAALGGCRCPASGEWCCGQGDPGRSWDGFLPRAECLPWCGAGHGRGRPARCRSRVSAWLLGRHFETPQGIPAPRGRRPARHRSRPGSLPARRDVAAYATQPEAGAEGPGSPASTPFASQRRKGDYERFGRTFAAFSTVHTAGQGEHFQTVDRLRAHPGMGTFKPGLPGHLSHRG
jgi:hypothetical protein